MRKSFWWAALAAAALVGCEDKLKNMDDTSGGDDDDDDTVADDTAEPDPDPVWEDLRLETSDTLTGCYASGSGLYVVTEDGLSWVRQGGDWGQLAIETEEEALNGMWGIGAADSASMVAVGDAGWVATWAGGGWATEDIGTANLESVSGASAANLMAVGWGGVFSNAAGAWAYTSVEGNPRFNHVWFDGNFGVAVGEDGAIGAYNNGKWVVTTHETRRRFYGVHGSSPSNVWVVGERGTVLMFDGKGWTQLEDVPTDVSLWAVYAASPTEVYVVGNNGTALLYNGAEWVALPTGVDNVLYAISASSAGTMWVVGNRGMTLRYE